MQRLAFVLLCALAACQPWYRDDLIAGRRAAHAKNVDDLVNRAIAASAAGDAAGAAALMREALLQNPLADAGMYTRYAEYLVAAGRPNAARAVLRFRIANLQPGESSFYLDEAIIRTYVAADETAAALDQGGAADLRANVSAHADLSASFQELIAADDATEARTALTHLRAFLDAYGCADHAQITAMVDAVQAKIAAGVPELADVLARADAAVAAGDPKTARLLYAEAYRVLPRTQLADHAAGFKTAAASAGDVAESDPIAYAIATEGDTALKDHHLGRALHLYRRAVAEAPWWRAAHENLALLLDLAGRADAAQAERDFVAAYF